MQEKKILLILNPRAGKCKGAKQLYEIIKAVQDSGFMPMVLLTYKTGDARRFARDYGGEVEIVCCIGGDGTLSEVVSGMVDARHDTPIGYIPAGSTNDYASSLGLSDDPYAAARDAVSGRAQAFDIGLLNGRPFAYVAAFGMLAKVSYSVPQDMKNLLGHMAYVLEGVRDLHMLKAEKLSIDADDEHIEGEYILGTISNTTSIGGILQFNPAVADMNDGYLELMLIALPANPWELTQLIQALSARDYSNCGCITFRKCRAVRITAENPIAWTLDGEAAEDCREVRIDNVPSAIRVMVRPAE